MGVEVDREAPFYFTKSPLAIVPTGATVPYPAGTENYHYEMELVDRDRRAGLAGRASRTRRRRSSATPPAST